MIKKNIHVKGSSILVLGITFKEDCPDVRNTKVIDVVNSLKEYGCEVCVLDPWANAEEVNKEYNLIIKNELSIKIKYDAIVLAVSHNEFLDFDFKNYKAPKGIVYDIKAFLGNKSDYRL